jgi:hypothetical protein
MRPEDKEMDSTDFNIIKLLAKSYDKMVKGEIKGFGKTFGIPREDYACLINDYKRAIKRGLILDYDFYVTWTNGNNPKNKTGFVLKLTTLKNYDKILRNRKEQNRREQC